MINSEQLETLRKLTLEGTYPLNNKLIHCSTRCSILSVLEVPGWMRDLDRVRAIHHWQAGL